jgi:hypothetical protein
MMPRKPFLLRAALAASLALLASCSGRNAVSTPLHTYQMGERVELAPLTYAVFEKNWLAQLGEGTEARLPQNRFLVIRLTVTSGAAGETYVPNLSLDDDAGNSCAESNNGDGVLHWIGYLRSIKPAETLQGSIVFDCAPKHYRLKLVSDTGKAAYVDIPLSFETETTGIDLLPKPKGNDSTGNLAHPK